MSRKYRMFTALILCFFMTTSSLIAFSCSTREADAWEFGGMEKPKVSVEYDVGNGPQSVTVVDINGDGNIDIISANSWSHDVSVLLGDGEGEFSETKNSPFAVGNQPHFVAVADINEDDHMDIITANYGSHDVSVLLGDGSGDFTKAPNSPFEVGTYPLGLAIADINDDDYKDILVSNWWNDNVDVLLGDGNGDFSKAPNSPFEVGERPRAVAVADINGDEHMDILTANGAGNDVSVLLGDSSGDYSTATISRFPVKGRYPLSVDVVDINEDDRPDIVTGNGGGDVSVLLGDGSGNFLEVKNSPFTVDDSSLSVAVADINDDDHLDIVAACRYADVVSVLIGDGTGNFSELTTSPFTVGDEPTSVVVANLDDDGNMDIVTASYGDNAVSILMGIGNAHFFTTHKEVLNIMTLRNSPFAVGEAPQSVAVADINDDGNMDIVSANGGDDDVSVLLGDDSGGFSEAINSPFSVGFSCYPCDVTVADIDEDEKMDLVIANGDYSDVCVLLGDGSGDFTEATNNPLTVGNGPRSVAVVDINEDDHMDIICANSYSNDVSVLLGDGSGGFTEATNSPFTVGDEPMSVAVADINNDDKMDIVSANGGDDDVSVLLGDGSGGFLEAANSPFAVGPSPKSVAIANVDNDEHMDIISANYGSDDVSLLLGDSSGDFMEATNSPFAVGDGPYDVAVADVNDDGNIDILTCNYVDHDVSLLLGLDNGALLEVARSPFAVGEWPVSITVADGNNNSPVKIVTANQGDNDVSVLEVFVDFDFDGVPDKDDTFPANPTEWQDFDLDLVGNFRDEDDDNDGVPDLIDAFPYNPAEWNDTDNDGTGDNADNDDDDDGYLDIDDRFPTDKSEWNDTDDDGIGDNKDSDIDSDDYSNTMDRFPNDPNEWNDTDNDGLGDNTDTDIDGDGYHNNEDAFPTLATEWGDFDEDGIGDNTDTDRDGDNYPDMIDRFPLDPEEWNDTDNNGLGDNTDKDIDGDSFWNDIDAFPMDPSEWFDTDKDGLGNNRDTDDDNDGAPDLNDDFPEDPSKYRMDTSSEDETMDIGGYTVKRQYLTYVAPGLTVLVGVFLFVNKRGRMALYMSRIKKAPSLVALEDFFEKKVETALGKEKIKSEQYLALKGQKEKKQREFKGGSLEGFDREKKLELLQEKLLKGEISEDTYRELKNQIAPQPLSSMGIAPALSTAFTAPEHGNQVPQAPQAQWQQLQPQAQQHELSQQPQPQAPHELGQFDQESWVCSQCGKTVYQNLPFCSHCGGKKK